MSKQIAEKVVVVAVSDEAAASIAEEHGLAEGDWVRIEDVNTGAAFVEESKGVAAAVCEMAFDNAELADPACRALIDGFSAAGWKNHLKPAQRI